MGRGGDGSSLGLTRSFSFDRLKAIGGNVKQDLVCLKTMWFSKASGDSHADRLESFYSPQAHAYDNFRANFLWGRRPMLAACSSRLRGKKDIVWVDLGGGTGENVDMMFEYLPRENFKTVYVVDLCHSLCEQAKLKVIENGWDNVKVVEADACVFDPDVPVTLVTFSYSLSMIPPFHDAVDQALKIMASDGLLGVADFYVSGKYDLPLRQMMWARRFFWRSIFDMDNIDIGPERRNYLDHTCERVWEFNGEGSIPYVPFLRAPWYAWVGRKKVSNGDTVLHETKVEAPPMFPPTFLYTMSWEDPDADRKVLDINKDDVCLTLTSGGCNSLNLLIEGAKEVYSVDCNPAQSALLEMKAAAIRELSYEDTWKMFGEGKHPDIQRLYEHYLAPVMCQKSIDFWNRKLYHFRKGLYYAGGMGKVCLMHKYLSFLTGTSGTMYRLSHAASLKEQVAVWESIWLIRFLLHGPKLLVNMVVQLLTLVFFNRFCLWFGGGIPCKQYKLITRSGMSVAQSAARTFDGIARYSHLRTDNYFYYNCLNGHYLRDNCPAFLKPRNFNALKSGRIDGLNVVSGTFNGELKARKYTKVILMDHVDWMDKDQAQEVVQILKDQVLPGGRVIWRSAGFCPPYVSMITNAGFDVTCLQRSDQKDCYFMDRVNMYNSFYVAVKKEHTD